MTGGYEIYPHRRDLATNHFWKCDRCKNCVGCHPRTSNPLGVIATPELKSARGHIHALLDPLWKSGPFQRGALYAEIAKRLEQKDYHTANIRSVEEARKVYRVILTIKNEAKEV